MFYLSDFLSNAINAYITEIRAANYVVPNKIRATTYVPLLLSRRNLHLLCKLCQKTIYNIRQIVSKLVNIDCLFFFSIKTNRFEILLKY